MLVSAQRYARGSLISYDRRRVPTNAIVANAMHFGQTTSVPQGYNDPVRSLTPTIQTGGNIAARMRGVSTLTADLKATGNMAGTLDAEADMIGNANVYFNGYATFDAVADMTAAIGATGNMAANMDILARPSANDIAQEVWNSRKTAFVGTGTMGKSLGDAEAAAKLGAALSA